MKKRNRKLVAIVVAVVVAGGAGLIYFARQENPDYTRAAKRLPAAKQRAIEIFGTLTWKEFRTERGIEYRDDTDEWESLHDSIPADVEALQHLGVPPESACEAAFANNRDWLAGLSEQVRDLGFQHSPEPTTEEFTSYLPSLSLTEALSYGLIGAAEVGDTDAMVQFADTVWEIVAKLRVEPDLFRRQIMNLNAVILNDALLRTAIRHRSNTSILDAVRRSTANRTKLPTFADVVAGDIREIASTLDELRAVPQDVLGVWLDRYSKPSPYQPRGVFDRMIDKVTEAGSFSRYRRRVGRDAASALEARYWETVNELASIFKRTGTPLFERSKEITDLYSRLIAQEDISYELAWYTSGARLYGDGTTFERIMSDECMRLVMSPAVEMVCRFPEHSLLPSVLPSDLSFDDIYGGGEILYRKTATGFVIYTRYENGVDDGFLPTGPGQLSQAGYRTEASKADADYGVIVSYAPAP